MLGIAMPEALFHDNTIPVRLADHRGGFSIAIVLGFGFMILYRYTLVGCVYKK